MDDDQPDRVSAHLVHSGFSSRMKATKVWTPAQMDERARFISMKKNRKDLEFSTIV